MLQNILRIVCLAVFSTSAIYAQDTTAIATENIQVIRNYEAIIQQAKRKKVAVQKENSTLEAINFSYEINSNVNLDFERPEPVVRPKTYQLEDVTSKDLYDGRIYGGYGNYKSLTLGGGYHYYIEDWVEAGVKFDHMSANDSNFEFQKFANSDGELYFGYYLNSQNKVKALVRGGNSRHYSPLISEQDSAIQHNYNNYGATLSFDHNSFEKTGISLRTRLSYDQIKQTIDTTLENKFNAHLNLLKKINNEIALEIPFNYSTYNFSSSIDTSYSDLSLSPFVRYYGNNFNLNIGAQFIFTGDDNFFFPTVRLEVPKIVEEVDLTLYTEGQYSRLNMSNLSDIIPYYQTALTPLTPSFIKTYNLQVNRQIGFANAGLKISFNDYVNDIQIVDLTTDTRPIVESISRNELSITPSLKMKNENNEFNFSVRYNLFLNVPQDSLTYLPSFEIDLSASHYFINRKLRLFESLSFNDNRNLSISDNLLVEPLKSFLDLSLGLEYRIIKSVGVYARGTNLLANSYSMWYRHPVFERQFWGGIKVDF